MPPRTTCPRGAGETRGKSCKLDDLIHDIVHELRTRPYELVLVAGGYQLCAPSRALPPRSAAANLGDAASAELTPTELLALAAIAYLQPATRAEISRLAGKTISRDVIARLKRLGLIDAGLRAPEPGAPFAYVTTKKFLGCLGSPRCAIFPISSGSRRKACYKPLNVRPKSMPPWGLAGMRAWSST